jgi:hypothetical protein
VKRFLLASGIWALLMPTHGCGGMVEGDAPLLQPNAPAAAHELCNELFTIWDGCGIPTMELCLARWETDGECDDEEETLLDCVLHGDGYQCNYEVFLYFPGECNQFMRQHEDCF